MSGVNRLNKSFPKVPPPSSDSQPSKTGLAKDEPSAQSKLKNVGRDSFSSTPSSEPKSLKGRTLKWIRSAGAWIKSQFVKIFSIFKKDKELPIVVEIPRGGSDRSEGSSVKPEDTSSRKAQRGVPPLSEDNPAILPRGTISTTVSEIPGVVHETVDHDRVIADRDPAPSSEGSDDDDDESSSTSIKSDSPKSDSPKPVDSEGDDSSSSSSSNSSHATRTTTAEPPPPYISTGGIEHAAVVEVPAAISPPPKPVTAGGPADREAFDAIKQHAEASLNNVMTLMEKMNLSTWDNTEIFFESSFDILNLEEACKIYLKDGMEADIKGEYETLLNTIQQVKKEITKKVTANTSKINTQIDARSRVLQTQQREINQIKARIRLGIFEKRDVTADQHLLAQKESLFTPNLAKFFQILAMEKLLISKTNEQRRIFNVLKTGFAAADFKEYRAERSEGGLYNMDNSCYINAGLQMLRGSNFLKQLLDNFRELDEEQMGILSPMDQRNYPRKLEVVSALREVNTLLEAEKNAPLQVKQAINEKLNAALLGLRFAIFNNKEAVIYDYRELTDQQDGADLIRSILITLNNDLPLKKNIKNTLDGMSEISTRPVESENLLRLAFREGKCSLQEMISDYFEVSHPEFKENGKIIDREEQIRLTGRPEFIPVMLLRYINPILTLEQREARYFNNRLSEIPQEIKSYRDGSKEKKEFEELFSKFIESQANFFDNDDQALAAYIQVKKIKEDKVDQITDAELKAFKISKGRKFTSDDLALKAFIREILIPYEKEIYAAKSDDEKIAALYAQENNYNYNKKIETPFEISRSGLVDLRPGLDETSKRRVKYKVVSFEIHEGRSVNSGHYIGYRLGDDGKWRKYNDSIVSVIDDKEAHRLMKLSYNLLLKRVDPEPAAAAAAR